MPGRPFEHAGDVLFGNAHSGVGHRDLTAAGGGACGDRVLRGYLLADGDEVTEAADGEAAMVEMRDNPPDLVLLDVMLPRIDGLEVLRRLRSFSDAYVMLAADRRTRGRRADPPDQVWTQRSQSGAVNDVRLV